MNIWIVAMQPLKNYFHFLEKLIVQPLGVEYMHISDPTEKNIGSEKE